MRCLGFEDEVGGEDEEDEAEDLARFDSLVEVEIGKTNEDDEGDDLLDRLELDDGELVAADPVSGDLEAILEEGDPPASEDDEEEGGAPVLEVAIPGEGHEDVREGEEDDGLQRRSSIPSKAISTWQ